MNKVGIKNDLKSKSRRNFIKAGSLTSAGLLIGVNARGALAILSPANMQPLDVNPLVRVERNGKFDSTIWT